MTMMLTIVFSSEYGSTTPDDLWNAMQTALDKSDIPHGHYKIKQIMDTWTNQNSYPVVNVMKNYTTGEITIFQKCVCGQKSNNEWWIPITFATQSNPNFSGTAPRYWLQPNQNITFKIDPNDWIIVNLQQTIVQIYVFSFILFILLSLSSTLFNFLYFFIYKSSKIFAYLNSSELREINVK